MVLFWLVLSILGILGIAWLLRRKESFQVDVGNAGIFYVSNTIPLGSTNYFTSLGAAIAAAKTKTGIHTIRILPGEYNIPGTISHTIDISGITIEGVMENGILPKL